MGVARDLVLELKGTRCAATTSSASTSGAGRVPRVLLAEAARGPLKIADLRAAAERVESHLNRRLMRVASPTSARCAG